MMLLARLAKLQKLVAPAALGIAVAIGTIMSIREIRQRNARRKQWFAPVVIIGVLLLVGIIGAVVEQVVMAQPQPSCSSAKLHLP